VTAMTRDEIIRMAREAGFDVETIEEQDEVLERESDYYTRHPDIGYMVQTHTVERFADLVAAAERDACAAMCEQLGVEGYGTLAIAAAIRQRGSK